MWRRVRVPVKPTPRALPEYAWRYRAPSRATTATPWSTFRKVFFTDELLAFAVDEFNHYPKYLAASRTRPPYVPRNKQWPPKWVNDSGPDGPMHLTGPQYMKYILILYLLGVKGLNNANIADMFSNKPILREEWLCQVTSRRDLQRFLRQVRTPACIQECMHGQHIACLQCVFFF